MGTIQFPFTKFWRFLQKRPFSSSNNSIKNIDKKVPAIQHLEDIEEQAFYRRILDILLGWKVISDANCCHLYDRGFHTFRTSA
jgi:hypothetical protein